MSKEYVNFPIKLGTELHEAIRRAAFEGRVSIHKEIQATLREKYLPNGQCTTQHQC
jgi:hypothetical protein